ncbi:hypothetical protein [Mesorhizobium sp. Root552]|uniref:hypothetical protein n=1 Tax=Mesorhizobium sp. Root552 TaxID=1736555 RepID=UPI0009E9F538|nr:hypothetical protein [Mesorhizobium sp. Root552]
MRLPPQFIGLEQARQVLAEMGVDLNPRQMKRAADKDATGRRKLPFFVDPIEGTLKIEKGTLVDIYQRLQIEAEKQFNNNG